MNKESSKTLSHNNDPMSLVEGIEISRENLRTWSEVAGLGATDHD